MFNLKEPLRHWSLWLSGVATAALGFFLCAPDAALQVWNFAIPAEVKAMLPQETGIQISLGLLVASIVAKFIRQKAVLDWLTARAAALAAWLAYMTRGGDDGRIQ